MDDNAAVPPKSQSKKLSLDDLIPEKVEVKTSLGSMYVRNANVGDLKGFVSSDSMELGRVAVQSLTSRAQDKRDNSALSDQDFDALLESDFLAISSVIARINDWGDLPEGAGLIGLGDAVKVGKDREVQRHKKRIEDMRKSIDSSYGFLGKGALEKLQEQMSGLANMRESISASDSLKAAMAATNVYASPNTRLASEALRPPLENYSFSGRRSSENTPLPVFFAPEETVLGRAALENAENSREISLRMNSLAEVVGGLNQTIVEDILPAWIQKAESDQKHAELAFKQAGNSLEWTKRAVIASAVISLLATWWQISVSQNIDRENSVSQKTMENLLREQLIAQQKQSEQQALEAAQLKQFIERQSIDAEKLRKLLELKLAVPPINNTDPG